MPSYSARITVVLALLNLEAASQSTYSVPSVSAPLVAPIRFDSAQNLNDRFHARFEQCDKHDLCDGNPAAYNCSTDPNRNTVFLALSDGTVFFDAKMGIDADGSELSKSNPGATDQSETSFRYPLPNSPSLDADKVPYVVVPGVDFEKPLGIEAGDIAAVIYKDHLVYAIVGDHGPKCKLGEGSIQLHEELGQEGCKKRDSHGVCIVAGIRSIERDVLYFIFPRSKGKIIDRLTPENILERLNSEGQELMGALKAAYSVVPPTGRSNHSP